MGHVIWTAFHTSWHSQSLLTGYKAILRLLHHITSILDFYIITVDTCTRHLLCQAIHAGPWLQTQLAYEKIADSSMIKGYVYFWKTWLAFQNQKQMLPAIFCQMTCGWNKGLNSALTDHAIESEREIRPMGCGRCRPPLERSVAGVSNHLDHSLPIQSTSAR